MYNNFRRSRPSSMRGVPKNQRQFSSGNNSFNRPFFGGRFNQTRRNRPESQLGKDPSIFIKKAQVTIAEADFTPHHSFSGFNINEILKNNIKNRGYSQPTPIQDQAIVPILEGSDLIGLANTGTGKTAAFLIPLIDKVFKNRRSKVLTIVPTRELAAQINQEFASFANNMGLYSALLIGGSGLNRQISDVRRRPHFVVATPGRLRDLIERKIINLTEFDSFVLDEVDLMVDIGFIHDIKYFIRLLPQSRQSLFFSATIPPKVREILQAFVNNPVTVSVQQQNIPENIDQDVVRINGGNKVDKLHNLLIQDEFEKVLIFGRTKHGIEKLDRLLTTRGFKVGSIHGNRRQSQRQRILKSFKSDQIKILLATDVASRGLDIDNVSHVINYDLPETYEDYIHRIGRTGRANKKGIALTFVD